MPLNTVTIANPYADAPIEGGWAFCSKSFFDWDAKSVRLQYKIYVSKADADANKAPIAVREYLLAGDEFLSMLAAKADVYVDLAATLDGYVLTKPEFAGSSIEAAWVAQPTS